MKRLISIMMVIAIMAMVALVPTSAEITTSGGSDTARVELTYGTDTDGNGQLDHGANFKVTVPTIIPFTVDSDGNITTADNLKTQNLGKGPVDITTVHADTVNGWKIVEYGTEFKKVQVDSKQFTFKLNGDNFAAGSNVPLTLSSVWTIIDGKSSMDLPYGGTFAVQSNVKKALPIANVIFAVAWNKVT